MGTGLSDLMREYALADLVALTVQLTGLTEAAMRRAIRAVPDGIYSATTPIDSFASPARIPATSTWSSSSLVPLDTSMQ